MGGGCNLIRPHLPPSSLGEQRERTAERLYPAENAASPPSIQSGILMPTLLLSPCVGPADFMHIGLVFKPAVAEDCGQVAVVPAGG